MPETPPKPTPRHGTCEECQAERVRLIDNPKPGDVGQRLVCSVCAAKKTE